jgi:hypothetical protein
MDILICGETSYLTYPACRLRRDLTNMLTKLPLMTTEKKIFQDAENISGFCDFVIDIFTAKNSRTEHKYKMQ